MLFIKVESGFPVYLRIAITHNVVASVSEAISFIINYLSRLPQGFQPFAMTFSDKLSRRNDDVGFAVLFKSANTYIHIILIFTVFLISTEFSIASDDPLLDPFPSLRHGVGARGLSMGGTGVVTSSGAEAILWNPAQIVSEERMDFIFFANQVNSTNFSGIPSQQRIFTGVTFKIDDNDWFIFDRPVIGAALYYYNMTGLSVIGVDPVTANPIQTAYNDEGWNDLLLIVPFAADIPYSERRLSIGINFLTHQHSMFAQSSEVSFGWDWGAKLRIMGETNPVGAESQKRYSSNFFILLGARLRHIEGIKWKPANSPDTFTQNEWNYLDFGISMGSNLLESPWLSGFTSALQLRFDENSDYHLSVGGEVAAQNVRIRLGVDNILSNYSSDNRANSALTFGLGLLGMESMKIINGIYLDYCFRMYLGNTNTWLENENSLSLGYTF